ncbi:ROK family protein [Furfurilactobacillus entadae]|uniref:ROK family protein n=1 Tax=Furfurilactobacillus entadae TaxID=2922307 RepID=UPI0035EAAFB3
MARKVLNQDIMRDVNQKLVLQQVFNEGPISRIDVSKRLNLNKSTVSTLYNTLNDESLVVELGEGAASSNGGRKPIFTKVNAHWGYTVSFEIGYHHLHMMVNYLDGEIVSFNNYEIDRLTLAAITQLMIAKVRDVQVADTNRGLLGISIAVSGIVDDNRVTDSPFLDMTNSDLQGLFEQTFDVPVVLENEANLSAIYERDFNSAGDFANTLTVSIHKGIGAGIIINRQLYRGLHGEAGEIGRSIMMDANVGVMGRSQKVEDYCSEDAIIGFARAVKGDETLQRQDLVNLFLADDADIKRILGEFCAAISKILFNVATNFDPEVMYLNSPLIEALPELLSEIRQDYRTIAGTNPRIQLAQNTQYATLLGGCSLITHRVLNMDDYMLKF